MNQDNAWPAPAKINLFLHILGRRDDGYHQLQTAFQFLDFADQLRFLPRDDSDIRRCTVVAGVADAEDLCVRAAHLLRRTVRADHLGVDIWLDKKIPMGGGLGGGSSNAATTLCVLNRLWETGLTTEQLAELGLQLGADVPVFIHGLAAWAEGVGEILYPDQWSEYGYLIIVPPVHVATADIFNAPDLTRNCPPIKIPDLAARADDTVRDWDPDWQNVCETVVCQRYPEVKQALNWLNGYAPARMTGTGACVYGRFESITQAQQAYADLRAYMPREWQAFVAQGLNRSPLLDRL